MGSERRQQLVRYRDQRWHYVHLHAGNARYTRTILPQSAWINS